MKKLIKFIRKIKRNRLYSEKNRIQNRLTELNTAIHKIDCDNQKEILIEKKKAFYQKIREQLTLENYTPDQIDYYENELKLAEAGDQEADHLLMNNFQPNPAFKKETMAFKNV